MSYGKKSQTFNMTYTKIKFWHKKRHKENVPGCIYCEGNVPKIVEEAKKRGLVVVGSGENWFKIEAKKNYTPEHGGMTDESKELYNLIAE
ncbi:hypothetical protein [Bacillus paranthracis]|uniref:hypothetical protein n=1 Tax=Bacillus paranthracis TaxID=2026186 RepID=UPI003D660868|nr:hypothetical protein [Bacillus cereus]